MGRPKGSIVPPDVKRSRTNFAFLLRQNLHEQVVFDYYMLILAGKSPIIVRDSRCTKTGGFNAIEDPADKFGTPPERRDAALKLLLERRDGLPQQRVALEAEIRSTQTSVEVDPAALASLPPDRLAALVSTLRGVLATPGAPVTVVPLPPVNATKLLGAPSEGDDTAEDGEDE